jgi:hypothetical protein
MIKIKMKFLSYDRHKQQDQILIEIQHTIKKSIRFFNNKNREHFTCAAISLANLFNFDPHSDIILAA